MSSSTHTPGAALVAESPDADPVTRLVLGWLAGKRSLGSARMADFAMSFGG